MDQVATGRGPVCTLGEMETRGWGNRETSPKAEPWALITFRGEGDINHQAREAKEADQSNRRKHFYSFGSAKNYY